MAWLEIVGHQDDGWIAHAHGSSVELGAAHDSSRLGRGSALRPQYLLQVIAGSPRQSHGAVADEVGPAVSTQCPLSPGLDPLVGPARGSGGRAGRWGVAGAPDDQQSSGTAATRYERTAVARR